MPGLPGSPGKDGHDGLRGPKGEPGETAGLMGRGLSVCLGLTWGKGDSNLMARSVVPPATPAPRAESSSQGRCRPSVLRAQSSGLPRFLTAARCL